MKDSRRENADEYENLVYQYISQLVKNGEMPGATKYAQVHLHKTYYDAYGVTINPDISIEVFRTESSTKPSLYILIECKWSGSHTVNSGDYNEFAGNIKRLNESAVKGFMVTNTGFPDSVINRSRGLDNGPSTGIGLIVFNDNGANWIVERNLRNFDSVQTKFNILKGNSSSSSPVLFVDGQFLNFIDFLESLDVPINEQYTPCVPWIKHEQIRNIAEQIGRNFLPISINRVQTILKYIYPSATIVYKDTAKGVYGAFDFNEDILFLSNELKNDPYRANFTIAHEIGHIVIHKRIIQMHYNSSSANTQIYAPSDKVIGQLEVQANVFAASLLLPKDLLITETARRMTQLGIRPPLFKDYQSVNRRDCSNVCNYLRSFFQVSRAVIEIRLSELGILKYDKAREPKTIGEILLGQN